MDLHGTTVVMGLGRSGRAAARLAHEQGAERVVGVDLSTAVASIDGVELQLGPHRRATFLEADRIIVSPGIPGTQPDLAAAEAAGVPVHGELAFAASFLTQPMAAITGTNGKSTVTWFLGQLLEAAGLRPFVGGNLGTPLSLAVGGDHDVLVVEASSYQLERVGSLAPDVALILNLTPDHLARHGTMQAYAAAKARIFENMGPDGLAVLPHGDPLLGPLAPKRVPVAWLGSHPGVVRTGRALQIRLADRAATLSLAGFRVPGAHNLDNAGAAALAALALGVDAHAIQAALPGLVALSHRMEVVVDGDIEWIDDSKATNIDAARVGIGGLERSAVVLLGGQAKGGGFDALAPLLGRHEAVITFGESGPDIADELQQVGVHVHRVGALAEAVALARTLARSGQAVLLSPGCASFDEFHDFEHRGRVFAALARGSDHV